MPAFGLPLSKQSQQTCSYLMNASHLGDPRPLLQEKRRFHPYRSELGSRQQIALNKDLYYIYSTHEIKHEKVRLNSDSHRSDNIMCNKTITDMEQDNDTSVTGLHFFFFTFWCSKLFFFCQQMLIILSVLLGPTWVLLAFIDRSQLLQLNFLMLWVAS